MNVARQEPATFNLQPATFLTGVLICFAVAAPCATAAHYTPTKVIINADNVLEINGKKVFHIGFDLPPLPDAKAFNGKNGIEELRAAGATFLQTGPGQPGWWTNQSALALEQKWEDAAARHGMYCWVRLSEVPKPGDAPAEEKFRAAINRFKNHPGLAIWNSVDEPEWGKYPVEPLLHAYQLLHELDPKHPVSINHAPRGTIESLRAYNAACDITGCDIYPISYPPGLHVADVATNREISVVGDFTRRMVEVAEGKKPVWIYLQIAWSGVIKPGKTLRFPTLSEQRFMTYQAIIAGARGLIYFGGQLPQALSPEDARLGWNWTFWRRVLKPVIEEIGDKSPLYPALVAPESKLPIRVKGDGIEFCVREVGSDIFLLACKREGATIKAEFTGLPETATGGEVFFEDTRRVTLRAGAFTDWFAPFDVHVYRFKLSQNQ
jgi:hypothetical protein